MKRILRTSRTFVINLHRISNLDQNVIVSPVRKCENEFVDNLSKHEKFKQL